MVDLRNGQLHLVVRGEPRPAVQPADEQFYDPATAMEAGPVAEMCLPAINVAQLVQALLQVPPIDDLVGAVPFVCWFETQAELDQFVALIRRHGPDTAVRTLDDEKKNKRGTTP